MVVELLAKTCLREERIKAIKEMNKDIAVEIFLKHEMEGDRGLNSYITGELVQNVDIRAIHTPSFHGHDTCIEYPGSKDILCKLCEVAQQVAEKKWHSVIVTVGHSLTWNQLKYSGRLQETINLLKFLATEYPSVEIALENPVHGEYIDDVPYYTNVYLAESVDNLNVGTCLNISNALTQIHTFGLLKEYKSTEVLNIRSFVQRNSAVCKLLRLANASDRGSGYGKDLGSKSMFLSKNIQDVRNFSDVTNAYKDSRMRAPIVVDVEDTHLTSVANLRSVLNLLREIE